jgi:RND family efflux transporter MFP subunit
MSLFQRIKMIQKVITMSLFRYCRIVFILLVFSLIALTNNSLGEEKKAAPKKSKRPPLLVTTVEVEQGAIQAMSEFVGTTYFSRVSQVATDLEGLVTRINFDEGDMVKKGDVLVMLDTQILDAEIAGARAAFEQNQVDLENARRDFGRIDGLYKDGSISETDHDSYRSKKMRLEKLSSVLQSRHDKLMISKNKKSIKAPFGGTVVLQPVEVGEWVAKGGKVAVIADDSMIEVEVEVPIGVLENLEKGREVRIKVNNRDYDGIFTTFIPRGDIATRTFTATFSLQNSNGIVEGLEALVTLPKGGETEGLLVPRDAVVDKYGKTMVFRVVESKAVEVPVQVAGYVGLQAVVTSTGLEPGQEIVVRGCKRVEEGMSLQFR